MNAAAAVVFYLSEGFKAFYGDGEASGLAEYSGKALARVWKTERFSWWMTSLLHRFPDQTEFDLKMQQAELAALADSESAQAELARNYVGLPY